MSRDVFEKFEWAAVRFGGELDSVVRSGPRPHHQIFAESNILNLCSHSVWQPKDNQDNQVSMKAMTNLRLSHKVWWWWCRYIYWGRRFDDSDNQKEREVIWEEIFWRKSQEILLGFSRNLFLGYKEISLWFWRNLTCVLKKSYLNSKWNLTWVLKKPYLGF